MIRWHVRQLGTNVAFVVGNRCHETHWKSVRNLAEAMIKACNEAEELESVTRVIEDQAILLRAGTGLGITGNPRIFREAQIEAQYSRSLRRHMELKGNGKAFLPTVAAGYKIPERFDRLADREPSRSK